MTPSRPCAAAAIGVGFSDVHDTDPGLHEISTTRARTLNDRFVRCCRDDGPSGRGRTIDRRRCGQQAPHEGFDARAEGDGLRAVEVCRQLKPDLVVLDLMLPGLDGLEVCRRIQAERRVPVFHGR